MRRLAWLCCVLLVWPASASAQTAVIPTQAQNSQNQAVSSASNAPVSVTLAAAPHTRVHLYSVAAQCSGGTAAVSVTDGGTAAWGSDATFASVAQKSATWIPAYTGVVGQPLVITLGSCGVGNVGTLTVQADIF